MKIQLEVEGLVRCFNHVSTDNFRKPLQNILFEYPYYIATDGYTMLVYKTRMTDKPETSIQFRFDKAIILAIKKAKFAFYDTETRQIDLQGQIFTLPDVSDCQYPNWRQVIPTEAAENQASLIGINAEFLERFLIKGDKGGLSLKSFSKRFSPFLVSSETGENWAGFLMPIDIEKSNFKTDVWAELSKVKIEESKKALQAA